MITNGCPSELRYRVLVSSVLVSCSSVNPPEFVAVPELSLLSVAAAFAVPSVAAAFAVPSVAAASVEPFAAASPVFASAAG